MMQNAVMRSFEVVGEAARRVSPEFCESHPDVPWRLMGDFRNKLIHDYFALDLEVIGRRRPRTRRCCSLRSKGWWKTFEDTVR